MAKSTSSLFGAELHERAHTDTFRDRQLFRFVTTGREVTITRSTPSSGPEVERLTFDSPAQARLYATDQVAQRRSSGYDLVFSTTCRYRANPHPGGIDPTPDEVFIDKWTHEVRAQLSGPRRTPRAQWMRITGVFDEARYNHTASVIADWVTSAPHWVDLSTDHAIGLVGELPLLSASAWHQGTMDADGTTMSASLLGECAQSCAHGSPTCEDCATRVAELLGHWTADGAIRNESWHHRSIAIATAQRLVAAPIQRAHERTTAALT